jgi:hypothetical protein
VSGIAGRYATALFSAGKKAGQLDGIDKDLAQVRKNRERGKKGERERPLFGADANTPPLPPPSSL